MTDFFENRMELTWGERQIDNVGDGRSKDRSTYLKKPGRNMIRVRLLDKAAEQNLRNFTDSDTGRNEKLLLGVWGDDECEDEIEVLLKIRCLEILSVKKVAKLSAREMSVEEEGTGDKDLRWSSLLTACHRRFGLSETKLEKYCFFCRWGSIYDIG